MFVSIPVKNITRKPKVDTLIKGQLIEDLGVSITVGIISQFGKSPIKKYPGMFDEALHTWAVLPTCFIKQKNMGQIESKLISFSIKLEPVFGATEPARNELSSVRVPSREKYLLGGSGERGSIAPDYRPGAPKRKRAVRRSWRRHATEPRQ